MRFYLVDDCSRIPVEQVIGARDNVTIIRLPHNRGLAAALNVGLEHILPRNYKYVARMDADDVSYPHRFATQIAFLERNPEVALVGSGARFIDDRSGAMVMYYVPPLTQEDIRKALFFNNCFVHPTWMFRGEALPRLAPYSLDYPAAEDYEFLRRAIAHAVVANVPDILVDYRISTGGISVSKRQRQLLDRLALQVKYLEPTQWRAWPAWPRRFCCSRSRACSSPRSRRRRAARIRRARTLARRRDAGNRRPAPMSQLS